MRIRHRSVRDVLTLWYVGTLSVILCAFSATLYTTVAASLVQNIDRELLLEADRAADTLFAFWRAERTAALASGPGNWLDAPSETLRGEIERGRFPELVTRWAKKTGQLYTGRPVQVLYRDGRMLEASAGFDEEALPPREPALAAARAGHTVYETVRPPKRHRTRVVTRPVLEADRVIYLARTVASLKAADDSLRALRVWLLLLVPLTLVVTSSVGWFLATTAMRPVGRMITQAQHIGIGRLHERVDVPQTEDELEHLATTFNDMLERLEQGFKRLRQFSAATSHELRTPLTVMKGELEVTLRKSRTPEDYRRALRLQIDAIDEMTHTVEELLLLARSDAPGGVIEWRPVELGGLVERVSDAWRPLAETKGVQVELSPRESVWVRGEPRLLERIVANLLDNAIRHTPAQGRVTVRTERRDREACLVVQDTGPGIAPEAIPQIFDRFFKKRSPGDGPLSTGLGLGLCRWIVEVHHGRIDVASPPGRGATVTVRLPLSPPASA